MRDDEHGRAAAVSQLRDSPARSGSDGDIAGGSDPGAADGGEVARVVGLDAFDIPEERLPRAVI